VKLKIRQIHTRITSTNARFHRLFIAKPYGRECSRSPDVAVKQTSNAQLRRPADAVAESGMDIFATDSRWYLAKSVATGPHFERSPLLSKFLLYVVAETLAGRQASISEHKIGVAVFGRPQSYRTEEDNIVRNYARQLRRRLAEHFAGVGHLEATRIEIPIGGYVPAFIANESRNSIAGRVGSVVSVRPQDNDSPTQPAHPPARRIPGRAIHGLLLVAFGVATLTILYWASAHWSLVRASPSNPARTLWHAILPDNGTTYVVPSDAGFNLMEDISHRRLPLADYIGTYDGIATSSLNTHTRQDLNSQRYTDFVSLKIIALLARQPEFDPQRVLLRFPRDLRIDDLKSSNALIIGSANSNPWAALGDARTNFRIVPSDDMEGATIVNTQPSAGEQASYRSHWDEPSHETYALILFVPNLSATGHLLVVEGLDIAGTEAAAELLFHPESIASIIARARRADGSLHPFEILLRTTSIQSNAAGTQVIASRVG